MPTTGRAGSLFLTSVDPWGNVMPSVADGQTLPHPQDPEHIHWENTSTHTRTATGVAGRREDPYWEARASLWAGMRAAADDRWAHARTDTRARTQASLYTWGY